MRIWAGGQRNWVSSATRRSNPVTVLAIEKGERTVVLSGRKILTAQVSLPTSMPTTNRIVLTATAVDDVDCAMVHLQGPVVSNDHAEQAAASDPPNHSV